jgi:hypothetical protein
MPEGRNAISPVCDYFRRVALRSVFGRLFDKNDIISRWHFVTSALRLDKSFVDFTEGNLVVFCQSSNTMQTSFFAPSSTHSRYPAFVNYIRKKRYRFEKATLYEREVIKKQKFFIRWQKLPY